RRRGPPSGPLRSRAVSPARRRCGPPSGPLRSRAISPE
ncbi:growth inhibitor PemK, partial [Mycobacterium tuberculosis]